MSLLRDVTAALLGISTYQPPPPNAGIIDIDEARRQVGGQLQLPSYTQTRWYLADLETAERTADAGDMTLAGRLMAAARRDGILSGVLSTRTSGLVRLPRRFRGDTDVIRDLDVGRDSVRSVFDEMFPPAELALLAGDGDLLGVGVAELVPVKGRDYPVLVRLDPQYLQYVWTENQWYYRSIIGRLPITPGDGRWILHTPGGRIAPWKNALWRALGQSWIRKDHALWNKDAWEAKLANPARVAYAPQGATEEQKQSYFQQVLAWGINTVFGLVPGYEIKLLESNGRGAESFAKTVADSNTEIIITICGQTVTVDGGAGFQNSDIHKTIRADLIKASADGLAYTLNTQGIPVFVSLRYGGAAAVRNKPCIMEWDVTPPKDRNSEAQSLVTVAQAIGQLNSTLATAADDDRLQLDVPVMCERFGVPTRTHEPDPADRADAPDRSAQVASLVEIVSMVSQGQIPRDAAIAIIKHAFLVDDDQAESMLGSAGQEKEAA